jgi:hypothetical protein
VEEEYNNVVNQSTDNKCFYDDELNHVTVQMAGILLGLLLHGVCSLSMSPYVKALPPVGATKKIIKYNNLTQPATRLFS